jgi:hypothetical protein
MTLTVRLPDKLEQELAEYCSAYSVTKSEAVKHALEDLLKPAAPGKFDLEHPFIGCDKRPGDIARNVKRLLRERFRGAGSRG